MQILWFVNVPLPGFEKAFDLPIFQKAGWLRAYADALLSYTDVSLHVVTRYSGGSAKKVTCGNITHYILPEHQTNERLSFLSKKSKAEYLAIINDIQPDVIHFHGTEMHYGLLAADEKFKYPCVVSIQGLLSEYWPCHTGALSFRDQLSTHSVRDF